MLGRTIYEMIRGLQEGSNEFMGLQPLFVDEVRGRCESTDGTWRNSITVTKRGIYKDFVSIDNCIAFAQSSVVPEEA